MPSPLEFVAEIEQVGFEAEVESVLFETEIEGPAEFEATISAATTSSVTSWNSLEW